MVIKYKCWDKLKHEWRIPDLERLVSMFMPEGEALRIVAHPQYELVLWTGFEDEHGNDVYPGDILNNNYYVRWKILDGCWGLYNNKNKFAGSFVKYRPHMMSITGNVYQNPEWLELDENSADESGVS